MKISVIVPVYNVEKYLPQCVESIVNQTLKDIEIICINDGSNDSSKVILEKYQADDERIYILNQKNKGYGSACNAGLRLARGEYISIIESDDFIDKNMYEDMYSLAQKHNADIVKSPYYDYRDSEKDGTESISKIDWDVHYNMPKGVFQICEHPQFVYFHPSIWSCIYKRSFIQNNAISFIEAKGAGWVDNPFQIQTLCQAKKILYTDKAYYYYRLTNPSSSSNIVKLSNPFDRSDEVHAFLEETDMKVPDLLAFLYKREFSYIVTVLSSLTSEFMELGIAKILEMTKRMDKGLIYTNKEINDFERNLFEHCCSKDGIISMMEKLSDEKMNLDKVNLVN